MCTGEEAVCVCVGGPHPPGCLWLANRHLLVHAFGLSRTRTWLGRRVKGRVWRAASHSSNVQEADTTARTLGDWRTVCHTGLDLGEHVIFPGG